MHLPDGVLPAREWIPLAAVAGGAVAAAGRRARQSLDVRRVPVAGFLAAVVLVLQMLNFPLIGGASGHLTGTTLLVFVAGVEVAAVAMASVLVLQALLLQDGGLLALGANYVNIVLVPAVVALAFVPLARGEGVSAQRRGLVAGVAAWCGSVAGALSCATQLALAGVAPLGLAAVVMGGGHVLVGVAEGVLTAAAVSALAQRGMVAGNSAGLLHRAAPRRAAWLAPVLALATLAAVLGPLASQRPDVLESLLERVGHAGPNGR